MTNSVLYWFDPADDHFQGFLEWQRRYARAVIAAAQSIDWSAKGFGEVPCVWIRTGSINEHPKMAREHRRITTECVAFDAPDAEIAARIRTGLEKLESTWKLAVTGPDRRADAALPVYAALTCGVYVMFNQWRSVEAPSWQSVLGMPAVMPEHDMDLTRLRGTTGNPDAYPGLITLLARAVDREWRGRT